MMTDYFVRDLYEKSLENANKIYIAGQEAERKNQLKTAQQKYEMSKSRFMNCYELGKSYEDVGCMRESKKGVDKSQEALDRIIGRVK